MWRTTPWHAWHYPSGPPPVSVPLPPPDHWLNVVLALGALAAVAGVLVGAFFTALYGRRASVSLSATAAKTPGGYVILARPSVKAVGVFRVRFLGGNEGSQVTVTEYYTDVAGNPIEAITYPRRNLFGEAFVDGGETLTTTTLVPVPNPAATVFGWAVWLEVRAPNRFLGRLWIRAAGHWILRRRPVRFTRRHSPRFLRRWLRRIFGDWSWTDQVFVPVPGWKA
jgi:hypothetical protein